MTYGPPAPQGPVPQYPPQPQPHYQPGATAPQPGYAPGPAYGRPPYGPGYGGYGQGYQTPPAPPKQNTAVIIVAVVVALAIIGTVAALIFTRGSDPVSPTPPTASQTSWPTGTTTVPTSFLTGVDSPFCIAYMTYTKVLSDWSNYQSTIRDQDYAKAKNYMGLFLDAAKELQAGQVPDDAIQHLDIVVDYFEKVHAALGKGSLGDVSEKDTLEYSLANSRLALAGVRACYGG